MNEINEYYGRAITKKQMFEAGRDNVMLFNEFARQTNSLQFNLGQCKNKNIQIPKYYAETAFNYCVYASVVLKNNAKDLRELTQEIAELQQQLSEIKSERKKAIHDLNQVIKHREDKIQLLETESNHLKSENAKLLSKLDGLSDSALVNEVKELNVALLVEKLKVKEFQQRDDEIQRSYWGIESLLHDCLSEKQRLIKLIRKNNLTIPFRLIDDHDDKKAA